MRILFNLVKCGLANNGGCQTILRSAIELSKRHEVNILIDRPSRFTWFVYPEELLTFVSKDTFTWPECDVIIATGCNTIEDTMSYQKAASNGKIFWMRAHETWAMPEYKLISLYRSGIKIIANSEWQRRFLYELGIDSKIQYPGLPFDIFERFQKDIHKLENDKLILGALLSKKPRKKFEDVLFIYRKAFDLGYVYKLLLYGDTSDSMDLQLNTTDYPIEVIYQPSIEEKAKIYNECGIWLATTINEGLHIPPMEASLFYCGLVARDAEASGMSDYALNNVTAKTFFSIDEAVEKIGEFFNDRESLVNLSYNLRRIVRNKIGPIETNMEEFEKNIEKILEGK